MSDEALSALAGLLEACELLGHFPSQISMVTTPLLEKPKGGIDPLPSTPPYTGFVQKLGALRLPAGKT